MSTAAPVSRLGWRLLPAVVAGAVMVVAASITIDALRDHTGLVSPGGRQIAAPTVAGEAWKIAAFPVGTRGGLTKKQRARFEAQRPQVAKIVRKVFGAVAGEPGVDALVNKHFTPAAATALRRRDIAIPRRATSVTFDRRVASIGIQGTPPRTAAARVALKATAVIDGRSVTWHDRATVWLERGKSGWRVIAFDFTRKRA